MSVCVDDAFVEGDHWGRWGGGGHMQADTLEELNAMADRLGLKRSWLQRKPGKPWRDHYDLTSDKRTLAIELGAVSITWREAARRNSAARKAHLDAMPARLSTARLRLVPLPPSAAAALPEGRDEAAQIIGAGLSSDWPGPDLLDILPRQARASDDQARFGIWVIIRQDTGMVIGDIGFHAPPRDGTVEMGYWILPGERRQGYATEAAEALIAWAQSQPGVDAVLARCDEDNQPSIRTLERLGFSRTRRAKGQLHWRR
jgi:RimJ/RimL family protein N-acetyltransferase